jgi:hypothetical protein
MGTQNTSGQLTEKKIQMVNSKHGKLPNVTTKEY